MIRPRRILDHRSEPEIQSWGTVRGRSISGAGNETSTSSWKFRIPHPPMGPDATSFTVLRTTTNITILIPAKYHALPLLFKFDSSLTCGKAELQGVLRFGVQCHMARGGMGGSCFILPSSVTWMPCARPLTLGDI